MFEFCQMGDVNSMNEIKMSVCGEIRSIMTPCWFINFLCKYVFLNNSAPFFNCFNISLAMIRLQFCQINERTIFFSALHLR